MLKDSRVVGPAASLALAAVLAGACSPVGSDSVSSASVELAPPPAGYDSTAVCPDDGKWAVCSVFYRLKRAGFGVERDSGEVREPGLSQPGMRLRLGRGSMAVFIYVDSVNRRLDEATLDPANYLRPEAESTPRGRTLVRSANLLAVMEVPNGRNRERILDALLAGPPQAPSAPVPVTLPTDTTRR